jgi:hypothetical protein
LVKPFAVTPPVGFAGGDPRGALDPTLPPGHAQRAPFLSVLWSAVAPFVASS